MHNEHHTSPLTRNPMKISDIQHDRRINTVSSISQRRMEDVLREERVQSAIKAERTGAHNVAEVRGMKKALKAGVVAVAAVAAVTVYNTPVGGGPGRNASLTVQRPARVMPLLLTLATCQPCMRLDNSAGGASALLSVRILPGREAIWEYFMSLGAQARDARAAAASGSRAAGASRRGL